MLDWFMKFFKSTDFTLGCPIGNFTQEMGDVNPAFREKLKASLDAMAAQFAAVLKEAREAGHIARNLDALDAAHFIVSSWEGALMRMKVEKSTIPLETHARFIFDYILK
jgi:TetR/AcrR family transcriptional repressor of nem operon